MNFSVSSPMTNDYLVVENKCGIFVAKPRNVEFADSPYPSHLLAKTPWLYDMEPEWPSWGVLQPAPDRRVSRVPWICFSGLCNFFEVPMEADSVRLFAYDLAGRDRAMCTVLFGQDVRGRPSLHRLYVGSSRTKQDTLGVHGAIVPVLMETTLQATRPIYVSVQYRLSLDS